MALTNSSINSGRVKANDVRRDLNEARNLATELKKYLDQNDNYNKFVNGTDFGKMQNEKIQKILGLLNQNLISETTNLIARLNSFFNSQEELNRRAAAAAAAAAQAKARAGSGGTSHGYN